MATTKVDYEAKRDAIKAAYLKPKQKRPATSARGIHHLALISSDIERTIKFYSEVLGFPLVELFENRDLASSTHWFHDLGHGNLRRPHAKRSAACTMSRFRCRAISSIAFVGSSTSATSSISDRIGSKTRCTSRARMGNCWKSRPIRWK